MYFHSSSRGNLDAHGAAYVCPQHESKLSAIHRKIEAAARECAFDAETMNLRVQTRDAINGLAGQIIAALNGTAHQTSAPHPEFLG